MAGQEKKSWHGRLNDTDVELTPDNCDIYFHRNGLGCEYLDVHEQIDEDGREQHQWFFGPREFLLWLGGVAIERPDEKTLRLAERQNGSFRQNFGWNPPVHIFDEPTEFELDMYAHAMTPTEDKDLHRDLENALREEFEDGA